MISTKIKLPQVSNKHGNYQKQSSRGIFVKRCSENMQQIYRKTTMPKCDFNKVAKQLYWNHTLAWVFFCKFTSYLQKTFSYCYHLHCFNSKSSKKSSVKLCFNCCLWALLLLVYNDSEAAVHRCSSK